MLVCIKTRWSNGLFGVQFVLFFPNAGSDIRFTLKINIKTTTTTTTTKTGGVWQYTFETAKNTTIIITEAVYDSVVYVYMGRTVMLLF